MLGGGTEQPRQPLLHDGPAGAREHVFDAVLRLALPLDKSRQKRAPPQTARILERQRLGVFNEGATEHLLQVEHFKGDPIGKQNAFGRGG